MRILKSVLSLVLLLAPIPPSFAAQPVDTELPAAGSAADGASNPTAPFTITAGAVFNGSTWDRIRAALNGLNTSGTGILSVAIVGQCDDTTPVTVTENNFGHVKINCTTHALKVDLDTQLDPNNDGVRIYGSDDGGTTKRIIKTDAGGAIQVDCESGCGGGTQYNQGTATTDTDTLTMAGAVRRDTAAVATGVVDGDRLGLSTDSVGRLRTTAADTTQPISASSLPLPTGAATAANQDGIIKDGTGDTSQANVSGGRLHVDGSGVTQPVSGTVTANAGSGTFNNQQSNVTIDYDTGGGTQNLTVFGVALPASGGSVAGGTATNPLRTDPTGTTSQPVSGTVTANAGSGTFFDGIIRDGTGDTTQANVSSGRLQVDGSGVTQPVSNAGTFATQIVQGGNTAAVNASSQLSVNCANCSGSGVSQQDNTGFTPGTTNFVPVGGEVDDTGTTAVTENNAGSARITPQRALHVNLRDQSGAEVSVGGGTQYDEDTAASDAQKLTMAGVVRRDAPTTTTTTDGDRTELSVNAVGRLHTSTDHAQPAVTTQTITGDGAGTAVDVTGYSQLLLTVRGTYALSANGISFEASPDGTNYFPIIGHVIDDSVAPSTVSTNLANVTRAWRFNVTGMTRFRTNTDWSSGTVNVTITPVAAPSSSETTVFANQTGAWVVTANVGTAASSTGKAEDTPHGSGDTGIAVWGVRNDSLATTFTSTDGDYSAFAVDNKGVLRVDPSGTTTQPVSGTVTANAGTNLNTSALNLEATQSSILSSVQLIDDGIATTGSAIPTKGMATVGTDGTNARILKTDSSGELQVDVLTSALPTGAATLAEQQTQTTALQLIDNLPLTQGSTTSGQSGVLAQGAVTTSAPTYTTGQTSPLSLTTAGDLRMNCSNCSGSGAVHIDDATFTGATDDVAPAGFLYDNTPPSITDGRVGVARMNSNRQVLVDLATRLDSTNDSVTAVGAAASGAAKSGNPVQIGGVFNTTQPTVTTGQAVEAQATARGALIIAKGVDGLALDANQSVNVAQINGVTPLMGNGATGTGSHRVTPSNDSSAIANWGHGATGSASPSGATQVGMRATGNLTAPIICDNVARYNAATSGSTELVALTSSQVIYICGWKAQTNSATGVDVKLVYGTGTNCATSPSDITMTWALDTDISPGFVDNGDYGNARKTAASNALCINASGAVTVRAEVHYTKF